MNVRGRYCHVAWGQIGVNAHTFCWGHLAAILINSRFSGKWDKNRTCTVRLWSTRCAVIGLCGPCPLSGASADAGQGHAALACRCVEQRPVRPHD
jgi:hypothetical protein